MKVATYEATVENGQIRLSEPVRLTERAKSLSWSQASRRSLGSTWPASASSGLSSRRIL